MKLSGWGTTQLKQAEGCKLAAYADSGGVWTIGWGHTDAGITANTRWTQTRADLALISDVEDVEHTICTSVRTKLSQPQFDALVLFVFNIGKTRFATSTLRRKLNESNFAAAAGEFAKWIWATERKTGRKFKVPGLINRRKRELDIFNSSY